MEFFGSQVMGGFRTCRAWVVATLVSREQHDEVERLHGRRTHCCTLATGGVSRGSQRADGGRSRHRGWLFSMWKA